MKYSLLKAAEEELKKQTTDGASPTKKLKTSDVSNYFYYK